MESLIADLALVHQELQLLKLLIQDLFAALDILLSLLFQLRVALCVMLFALGLDTRLFFLHFLRYVVVVHARWRRRRVGCRI